ncbi:hypothetical protein Sango_0888400 [Sesamum angolense]|uniref:Nucleolar 27S pre-rRNA processing Urb2/Npa2 C-terminal domain-containing protein n=1 Tax=Sesamum angolense TaxID=2727404 RepID=A0AAE2BXL3_9LAMI|nr:hypothetical protein Sango_0888400 [Sesamum angolense]
MSFSAKTAHQKTLSVSSDEKSHREILISVRKELIVSVHHLLNIEYEVVGDDLESLWTMILSSAACCYSSKDVLGQPLLSSEILSLGCRLFDLYSELRQVDTSVFALCRAVRHSLSVVGSGEAYVPSCLCSSYSNSLSMLLGSLQFRLSFSNAIKAIPEGQAAGCIRQLSSDIMESLEWMKCGHRLAGLGEMSKSYPHSSDSLQFHFREELLSKNLIEIIRSSLSSLVSPQPDNCKELTVLVDGLILSKSTGCDNLSMCRILAVFFHLLLSCRSLFELLITLMPPAASRKMSGVIGFTVQCGSDWLGMTGSAGKCFLSWIFQPSVSLLNVIHSVSDICIQDSVVLCSSLVYLLNAMALKRLVDLQRLIQSSKHMLQRNQSETELKDDADLSSCRKRIRKWRKYVQELTEEAAGLTEFIMGVVSSIVGNQISAPSFDAGIDDTLIRGLHTDDTLNFSIGSLDDSSLPSILWCIICEHVEFWCPHAAKKDLKNFLTLLIRASLSCINDLDGNFTMHNTSKPGHLNRVIHRIALEFLSNNMSYRHTRKILLENVKLSSRYMASRFCRILQKSVSSIFATSEVELSESPDWGKVISAFSNLSDVQIGASSWIKPNMVPTKSCDKQIDVNFATCRCLLNLLKRMPEEHLSSKSSSLYITNILNLERLLVGSLLGWHSSLCSHNPYQTFRLFVTCRRVLWILIAASSKENLNGNQSLITPDYQNAHFLSYVSRAQCARAVCSLVSAMKLHRERKNLDPSTEESDQSECSVQLAENLDAWQSVLQLAEVLEENLQESLNSFRDASLDMKVECLTEFHDLNKLSSTIACFQGLLWGLASTFDTNTVNSNVRVFSSYNAGFMTRIMSCVDTFMNFTTYVVKAFFLEDEQTLFISACGGSSCAANESLSGHYDGNNDASSEGRPIGITAPSVIKDDLVKCNVTRKSSPAVRGLDSFLTEVQHQKPRLKGSFLIQVFSGEKTDASFFLRQLFLACSAILRLNMQIDLTSISWSAIERALVAVQEGLITNYELVCGSSNGGEASGVVAAGIDCLGLLLEFVTGIHPHLPQLSINYPVAGFVNLASSKYRPKITQYKKTMTSQPANPNTRTMLALICRKLLMKKIRVEKEVGPRRLNMIKRHIQSLVACLFNIILHLQGPSIFYGCIDSTKAHAGPDSGSVVLMCVEVLTKVSAKPSFFQIDVCHIAESLRVPGALFQFVLQLQVSEASVRVASQIGTSSSSVDRKFSVELYAACCRMLCSALKHHKSETRQCMALLEDSVSVLLHCLEIVNIDRARGEFFAWEVEEAVKCASSLRRVYEEVRQQKDVFGQCSFQFLSRYIWVYCGLGPGRKGIIREVDEALRPGVYALIDSCSADDLQLLHTVFGVLLILAVIFIFLGLQWYVSYESVVEATEEGMGWLLMAAPLVLLFAVRWLSTLDSPPCWWFSARSPWERRQRSTSGRGRRIPMGGGSVDLVVACVGTVPVCVS